MRNESEMILRGAEPTAMAPYQLPPALPPESPEPSIFKAIYRHLWMVIVCAIIGAGGAVYYLKIAERLYVSEAKINIRPSGPRVLSETLGSAQRSGYLYSQAELIKSTPILQRVAEMPGLADLRSFKEKSGGDVVAYLREGLSAEVGRRDDLIYLSVYSPYAEDAALMVKAVIDAYKAHSYSEKTTSSSMVLQTLSGNLEKAEAEVLAKVEEIARFHKANPNLSFESLFTRELESFSRQYIDAQIRRNELEATYPKDHPLLLKAKASEEALSQKYQDKLRQVMGINYKSADILRLDADLQSRKALVSRLTQRIEEVRVQKDAEQIFNNVEIYEPPRVAARPSFPRKNRTLAVATVAGMLLGAGLALLRDRLDGRMRSIEEIQTVIGLPILGVVPVMTGRRTAIARAMAVHLDPRSPVAEAYRTIRTAVYFGTNGSACKTLLITSPEPGDGKTTSASNLAIAIAQTGRSVLLLDADFRKPTQHKNLDIKDSVGLSSVLAGREPLERAIQRTGVEGLDILPCGPIPANPSEILNSREFGELVDSLASRYDHILFDSPPVNSVTDARILGAVCDATIVVLRADKSTRKAGEHARNALMAVGARVLGAVVNDAPQSRGYEVYGGSYYGSVDVHARSAPPMHAGFGSEGHLSRSN